MTQLEALAALVRTLREVGVSTYEGHVPEASPPASYSEAAARLHVKLTLAPLPHPSAEPSAQEAERPLAKRDPMATLDAFESRLFPPAIRG